MEKENLNKYLTQDELHRILCVNFSPKENTLKQARDIFVFSCFTGLSFVDTFNLSKENIKDKTWINGICKKTNRTFNIPLLRIPQLILNRYTTEWHRKQIFPVWSNQQINGCLREIGFLCEIKKSITFHTARNTFASLIYSNGISTEEVCKMMGYSINTIPIQARIKGEDTKREMSVLREKLKSMEEKFAVNI
jgi:site-specific recombinase XerD